MSTARVLRETRVAADADFDSGKDFRVIQFTPPGSGCSVIFGKNVTEAAPGSAQGMYLIVSDVATARNELLRRGVEISEVFHDSTGVYAGPDKPYLFGRLRVSGADPEHRSYRSFASFRDPDGNGWLFQEITTRLPGRVAGDTAYASVNDLASALRRASAAHGNHEKRIGAADPNWPDWYAKYMVAEQSVLKNCHNKQIRRDRLMLTGGAVFALDAALASISQTTPTPL